jgi:hypothetical protein
MNPADRELEMALQSVAPSTARIDAVAAAFAAGRQSGRRQTRLWQGAASVALLLAVGSWMLPAKPAIQPPGGIVAQSVIVKNETRPLPTQSLLILEDAMRRNGLDGLTSPNLPDVRNVNPADNL